VMHYVDFVNAEYFNPQKYLNLLEQGDAFRREGRFEAFLTICEARFATDFPEKESPSLKLKRALQVAKQVNVQDLIKSGKQGEHLKQAIHAARSDAIAAMQFN
jgi:tRNA nucleotidyltransferase (CCA-adding enzyme)